MKFLTLLLILFTSNVAFANKATQAGQILTYFGSGCSINGDGTKAAIGYTQNLIQVMENIKNDQNCKTISGSIADLTSLQKYVQDLQTQSGQKEVMALQREEQVLLLALSSTTNAGEISAINSELRQNQLKQAQYNAYDDYNSGNLKKSQDAMATLVINTQAFMATANANQECLQNNTSILSGIASMVGSVVSSVFPTYGPIVKAAVELTGQVVEFARKNRINNYINKASEGIAATAYQCAIETFENNWCSAQDNLNAIYIKEVPPLDPETDPMWTGIRIIDRELPILIKWLQKVRAGSVPTTTAEAERQNRAARREHRVQIVSRFGKGTINENREAYNDAFDNSGRWAILRKIILNIITEIRRDNDPSALDEIYQLNYAPYYLLGLSRDEFPTYPTGEFIDFGAFDPFTQWPKGKPPFVPDLGMSEVKFNAWIDQGALNMQKEVLQVLQVSPLEVMDDAINDEGKLITTPRKSITRVLAFMKNTMPKQFITENHRRIYLDTIDLLEKIAKNIDEVHNMQTLKNPLTALTDISNIAQLRFGTVLIDSRVTRTVRYALNDISMQATPDNALASQYLAADDIVKSIQRVTPNVNLGAVADDMRNTQYISQNSLDAFVGMFAKSIKQTLVAYEKTANKAKEGPFGPTRQTKARLCVKLMGVTSWPKKIPFELCKGAQLFHMNPKGPRSVVVTEAEMNRPLAERICHFRNFQRRSLIFQNYLNHTSPSKRP